LSALRCVQKLYIKATRGHYVFLPLLVSTNFKLKTDILQPRLDVRTAEPTMSSNSPANQWTEPLPQFLRKALKNPGVPVSGHKGGGPTKKSISTTGPSKPPPKNNPVGPTKKSISTTGTSKPPPRNNPAGPNKKSTSTGTAKPPPKKKPSQSTSSG